MGNFDVDIALLPSLGLEVLPRHVAFSGGLVEAKPSLEFVG